MGEQDLRSAARAMRRQWENRGEVVPIESHPRFRRHAEPLLSKGATARALGRSTRWLELRVREGCPSELTSHGRLFRLRDVQEWLNTKGGE